MICAKVRDILASGGAPKRGPGAGVAGVTFDDKELLEREPLIDQILIPSDAIQRRVAELGREISADYQGTVPSWSAS